MGALLPRRDQESEGSAWSRSGSESWPAFHLSPCSPQGAGAGAGAGAGMGVCISLEQSWSSEMKG